MKIKLEHIDNLRRGKKSGAKIGSRGTPHHLYLYEEVKYVRALKNKYLEVTLKDRENLQNLWEKVCIAQKWKHTLIQINPETLDATLLQEGQIIAQGEKKYIRNLVKQYV